MIKKLDNTKLEVATEIHYVFQVSYAVEAEILKATDFPPLKRTIDNFLISNTEFYAYIVNNVIAAVVEVGTNDKSTNIDSLVVNPEYFRKGIGSQLVNFVLETYTLKTVTVETGVANAPAIRLYKNFGFREVKQWDTEHGIRKIKFEIKIN